MDPKQSSTPQNNFQSSNPSILEKELLRLFGVQTFLLSPKQFLTQKHGDINSLMHLIERSETYFQKNNNLYFSSVSNISTKEQSNQWKDTYETQRTGGPGNESSFPENNSTKLYKQFI